MSAYTFSNSESYSESDVKAVMQNTYEDIIGFANRQIITYELAKKWIEDLTYILNEKVAKFFEVQLSNSYGEIFKSYRYAVDSYGYLSTGTSSGGIDYFSIPADTKAFLFVDLDFSKETSNTIHEELKRRGWGVGTPVIGSEIHECNYVNNNLRLQRSVITK